MIRLLALLILLAGGSSAIGAQGLRWLEEPRVAPAFELPSTDGSVRRLSDLHGRYVLINFWAVWCGPCRKEMPSMQAAYAQLKGERFDMVAIHVGPTLADAQAYAEKLHLTFDILVDEDMALSDWQVMGLPTTFLVDPQGRIVAEAVGERDWNAAELLAQLRDALRQP